MMATPRLPEFSCCLPNTRYFLEAPEIFLMIITTCQVKGPMQKTFFRSIKKLPKWWLGIIPIIGWSVIFNPNLLSQAPQPVLIYLSIFVLQIILTRWAIDGLIQIASL